MPKVIELTVELNVQKVVAEETICNYMGHSRELLSEFKPATYIVSCPGVWLCQDGRVSLSVFALGTSYQTCMLPPIFPLMYKDVFYFRKRFQETCALNNICCLLKEETIYCELVQWCQDCMRNECIILAQYLGALNDVLFPPNMCSNDGVDLLMRRTSEFPGILSPKIEICTKVRIDEVFDQNFSVPPSVKMKSCNCTKEMEGTRQKQVCHSAQYHRNKCITSTKRPISTSRSRSRLRSGEPRSCCSLVKEPEPICVCPKTPVNPRNNSPRKSRCSQYNVYNVEVPTIESFWQEILNSSSELSEDDDGQRSGKDTDKNSDTTDSEPQRTVVESRYIKEQQTKTKHCTKSTEVKTTPCVCEICKRYHELFHT